MPIGALTRRLVERSAACVLLASASWSTPTNNDATVGVFSGHRSARIHLGEVDRRRASARSSKGLRITTAGSPTRLHSSVHRRRNVARNRRRASCQARPTALGATRSGSRRIPASLRDRAHGLASNVLVRGPPMDRLPQLVQQRRSWCHESVSSHRRRPPRDTREAVKTSAHEVEEVSSPRCDPLPDASCDRHLARKLRSRDPSRATA